MVVFRRSRAAAGLLAHRVVSVKHFPTGVRVRTRGDSGLEWDGALAQEQLVGCVAAYWQDGSLRKTGRASDLAALAMVEALRGLRRVRAVNRLLRWMRSRVMQVVLRTKRDVVYRREGEEGLLFDPQSGEVKLLNETGVAVWEMLAAGAQPCAITDTLMADYEGAERAAVAADVERFICSMRASGMLADPPTG